MKEERPNEGRRDPETRPDLPNWAEKMSIFNLVRLQFHPIFLNAAGGPDINGPRRYIGIEMRCPICKHIQDLGPPGVDNKCRKCSLNYKYTAVKADCFLWIWKSKEKLVLSEKPVEKKEPAIILPLHPLFKK